MTFEEEIAKAHIDNVTSSSPEDFNRWELAMQLVGERHAKAELVRLVAWLLTFRDKSGELAGAAARWKLASAAYLIGSEVESINRVVEGQMVDKDMARKFLAGAPRDHITGHMGEPPKR